MFRDVARSLVLGEFPPPYISHVEPVGLYREKGWQESQGDTQLSVVVQWASPKTGIL
jgi:hypothetical protein